MMRYAEHRRFRCGLILPLWRSGAVPAGERACIHSS